MKNEKFLDLSINELMDSIQQSARALAVEQGASAPEAEKRAAELMQDIVYCARNANKPHKGEDEYSKEIRLWYEAGTVCKNDASSQLAWLEKNATPGLLHEAALYWNWDSGTQVLRWILGNSQTSASAASWQLVAFVTAGNLDHDTSQTKFMAVVADKLRSGFYKHNWALEPHRCITKYDKDRYFSAIQKIAKPEIFEIPDSCFGPFSISPAPKSDVICDDSHFRLSFDAWKRDIKLKI